MNAGELTVASQTANQRPILIFIWVAPIDPYPSLFASGPEVTWMRDTAPDVILCTLSGLPLSRRRQQLADLRELLRFTGAQLGLLDSVSQGALLLRAYGAVAAAATPSTPASGRFGLVTARSAARLINFLSRTVALWERRALSPWKNRRRLRVSRTGNHFTVHNPSTLSNSLANQIALIKHLAMGEEVAGAVFVTASAYVDQQRLATWIRRHEDGLFIGGSNALADRGGMGRPFMSGFCQYFSWEAIRLLADAKDLDHSQLNDEALTAWLLSRGISWTDPGIVWFSEELDGGRCPLCEDPTRCVVRCTSHGARHREAEFMRQLNHRHRGDD